MSVFFIKDIDKPYDEFIDYQILHDKDISEAQQKQPPRNVL